MRCRVTAAEYLESPPTHLYTWLTSYSSTSSPMCSWGPRRCRGMRLFKYTVPACRRTRAGVRVGSVPAGALASGQVTRAVVVFVHTVLQGELCVHATLLSCRRS